MRDNSQRVQVRAFLCRSSRSLPADVVVVDVVVVVIVIVVFVFVSRGIRAAWAQPRIEDSRPHRCRPVPLSLSRALTAGLLPLRTRHAHMHAHTVVDNAPVCQHTNRPSSHWHSVGGPRAHTVYHYRVRSWIVRAAQLCAKRYDIRYRRHRLVASFKARWIRSFARSSRRQNQRAQKNRRRMILCQTLV